MILIGDVLDKIKEIPDNSVHCCVTSPPYWGLRDYGVSGQIGLEPTLQEFIARIVAVFREVRRVLRKDGVCFVNLGDSYAGSWGNYGARDGKQRNKNTDRFDRQAYEGENGYKALPPTVNGSGLKPKDLCGVPWRVALALQDDGWWLRSDIIWTKPNPMPESVTDRPTKSHEYIFLLTKSSKYFWDAEGVREDHTMKPQRRPNGRPKDETPRPIPKQGWPMAKREDISFDGNPSGRNLRTVWTIPTESFSEAHFATYPQRLVETCIKAGTSEWGCCSECGSPWVRVVESKGIDTRPGKESKFHNSDQFTDGLRRKHRKEWTNTTTGWRPTCTCNAALIPCTVFDPFLGSGTTALVAQKMNRRWIGIELNPTYAEMAKKRIYQGGSLFCSHP